MRYRVFSSSLAGSFALGVSAIALSATAQAQDDGASENDDTIIVTTTRREESIQEVPVSVTAIGADKIEIIKPRDLRDLTGLAPNTFIGETTAVPGGGAIFIRGQGYSEVEKTQNPAVGVNVDGVFLGTNTGQLVDAFDVEQIEVGRGPQGIFFGKNTTGGVVSVTRTKPTREFGVRASAAYGSNEEVILKAVGNVPLGEQGGIKIGGVYRDTDGYTQNLFTGHKDDGYQYFGINAALEYDLTEWFNVQLIYDHFDLDSGGTPIQYGNLLTTNFFSQVLMTDLTQTPGYNAQTGSLAGLGPREVLNNFTDEGDLNTDIYNATLTFDTPLGELVSVTAFLDSEDIVTQDFDGTCVGSPGCPAGLINLALAASGGILHTTRDQGYEQFTQEIRLAGDVGRLDYLFGFYYYDHEIDFFQDTNGAVFQNATENNDSWSLFGNLDYELIDNLTVSAGVRYIDESKDYTNNFVVQVAPGVTVPIVTPIEDSISFDDVITRFAIDWQALDNTLFYASRAEGFRSGGFSIRGTLSEQVEGQTNCAPDNGNAIPNEILCPDNNFLNYNPETVTAYEIGTKNTFFDNQVVFNLALFRSKIEEFQINQVVVTPGYGPGTNTYLSNLPEVVIKGLELELVLQPGALEGFTLTGLLGLQDPEIEDGVVAGERVPLNPDATAGAPGTVADFTGTSNVLFRIADYNFNISGAYETELGAGTLRLGLGYNYIDDHSLGSAFGAQDIQPGYGLLNAYVGYDFDDRFGISLSGRNLTNKDYRVNSLPSVFFQRWADDLTWLVEVKAAF
jgi:iron complex outermembrane receptor protein